LDGREIRRPSRSGIQLADENLVNRPYRFVTGENPLRLDTLRAGRDPDGLFVSWLGRPELRTDAADTEESPVAGPRE
jgi:hypothetical protein